MFLGPSIISNHVRFILSKTDFHSRSSGLYAKHAFQNNPGCFALKEVSRTDLYYEATEMAVAASYI